MIRRISLAAIMVLMALPTPAQATHSDSPGPKHDFTLGGGITGVSTHFGFAAQSRPDGTDFGHVVFKNQIVGTETVGHVICVRTDDNLASFVFEIEQGMPQGSFRTIFVEDNGPPVDGEPVDAVTGGPIAASPPNECPDPMEIVNRTLSEGNIVVHDSAVDA